MEKLFFYIFLFISGSFITVFFIYRKFYVVGRNESEVNFGVPKENEEFDLEYIKPAQREHVAYQEQQSGFFAYAIKRAPGKIITGILIQVSLMMFTGYLSVKNIERLAMAGSAVVQGDYSMAVTALWPIAKDSIVEQSRVARGNHPFLTENNLNDFAYIGQIDGKHYAEMETLYSTQNHDPDLSKDDPAYGTPIIGLSAVKARDVCKEKYENFNADVVSPQGWMLGRSHILAARNVREYPKIAEWTNKAHERDTDDYMVLSKESGVKEYAVEKDIDREENGLYIDSEDIEKVGFRCEITW